MQPMIPDPPDSPRLFRPRGIGEILQHAFEIYRQHWKNLLALVAIIVTPLTILQVLISDRLADAYDVSQTVNGELVINGSLTAVWLRAPPAGGPSLFSFSRPPPA